MKTKAIRIRLMLVATSLILLGLVLACAPQVKTIAIQPLGPVERALCDTIALTLRQLYSHRVIILPGQPLPPHAFVNIKKPRYRADSLLRFLKNHRPDSVDYVLGLTAQDISTTKKDQDGRVKQPESKYLDWGIFGLGYRPGSSSIVSTYRLEHQDHSLFIERLRKVSLHEIGHNLGLRHCTTTNCVMQDAAETIRTVDTVDAKLCNLCRKKIRLRINL